MKGQFNCPEGADTYFFDKAEILYSGKESVGLYSESHRNSNLFRKWLNIAKPNINISPHVSY